MRVSRLRVLSQAHAVALQARCGRRVPALVTGLRVLACDLPEEDGLKADLSSFDAGWRQAHDPQAMAQLGEVLQRAVVRHLWAPLMGAERADLHG